MLEEIQHKTGVRLRSNISALWMELNRSCRGKKSYGWFSHVEVSQSYQGVITGYLHQKDHAFAVVLGIKLSKAIPGVGG